MKIAEILIEAREDSIEPCDGGDCFVVAGKAILDDTTNLLVLVHGMVTGTGKLMNKRFDHAWVEIGDVVLDNSNNNNITMRKERYYELGNIDPTETQRYSNQEALKNMVRFKHWGPWE